MLNVVWVMDLLHYCTDLGTTDYFSAIEYTTVKVKSGFLM